jgi:septum formation protein
MVSIDTLLGLKYPLILASSSPRRKHLLKMLGFEFQVIPPEIDEDNLFEDIFDYSRKVCEIAKTKAMKIASTIKNESIVIGADTLVVLDGRILTKPRDDYEARAMLKKLSGRTHIVFTGLALVHTPSMEYRTCFRRTEVSFRQIDEKEIDAYVSSGSPLDKAGAYGIQDDFGAVFVKSINGCYYNVVGLPLEAFYSSLKLFIDELEAERKT